MDDNQPAQISSALIKYHILEFQFGTEKGEAIHCLQPMPFISQGSMQQKNLFFYKIKMNFLISHTIKVQLNLCAE